MSIIIDTDYMRKKMGEVIDCVRLRGDEFIIERKHSPVAALISVSKLEALEKAARNFLNDYLSHKGARISNQGLDKLLNEAKIKTRKAKKS